MEQYVYSKKYYIHTTDAKLGHQTVFSILQSRDHNSLLLLIHFALSLFLTVELMILKSKLQIECTIAIANAAAAKTMHSIIRST